MIISIIMEIRYEDGIKYSSAKAYALCILFSLGLHFWLSTFSLQEQVERKEEIMRVLLKQRPVVQESVPVVPEPVKKPTPVPQKPVPQVRPIEEPVVKETVKTPVAEPVKVPVQEAVPVEPVKPAVSVQKPVEVPMPKPVEPIVQQPAFDYSGYQNRLGGRLESNKKYPYMARRKGMEGVVRIKAVIGADGSLVASSVFQSSGFRLLDDEAVKLIRSVFPFEKGSGEQFSVIIPINYRLTE